MTWNATLCTDLMKKDFIKVIIAYLAAGSAAVISGKLVGDWHPVLIVAVADLAGTLVVFAFSVYHDNSSYYDPYWSLAPILIATYWLISSTPLLDNRPRQAAVMALVLVWAFRLTLNWAVRWRGGEHEDWRYAKFRDRPRWLYWLISFFGFHLMPTVMVFLGCLPLIASLSEPATAFGLLDLIALLVTAGAIWIEARADLEITRFSRSSPDSSTLMKSGIWSLSRHPNYFGEITFWWGLYAFALAANPQYWWTIIGPIAITFLFLTISIPMIEKHMQTRRPEYKNYQKSTSMLIPWRNLRR